MNLYLLTSDVEREMRGTIFSFMNVTLVTGDRSGRDITRRYLNNSESEAARRKYPRSLTANLDSCARFVSVTLITLVEDPHPTGRMFYPASYLDTLYIYIYASVAIAPFFCRPLQSGRNAGK